MGEKSVDLWPEFKFHSIKMTILDEKSGFGAKRGDLWLEFGLKK